MLLALIMCKENWRFRVTKLCVNYVKLDRSLSVQLTVSLFRSVRIFSLVSLAFDRLIPESQFKLYMLFLNATILSYLHDMNSRVITVCRRFRSNIEFKLQLGYKQFSEIHLIILYT